MRLLQRKKIGMGAGTIKNALILAYFIHKKPIRFYMQLPVWFPLSFEGMVTTMLRQWFLIKQKHDYRFQLIKDIPIYYKDNLSLYRERLLNRIINTTVKYEKRVP